MVRVSVVIPAYNEEKAIGPTIEEIQRIFLSMKHKDYEIIVVNNNSKDKTATIAKKAGAKVLFEKHQPGYGASYKRGFKNATGDVIITGDADATYPFYEAPRFLKIMKSGKVDFINTNRYADLSPKSMPFVNYCGNIFLTVVTNLLYGTKTKDSQSGMWIFNRKFLESINMDIMGPHMSFSQEIKLYAMHLKNIRFKEIPITYRVRLGEKKLNPLRDGFDNLSKLITFKNKLRAQ